MSGRGDFEIGPEELQKKLQEGKRPVLLDVRRPDEVEIWTFPGAVHISMFELQDRLGELDPALETVVFCHHGTRSLTVTAFLRTAGFRNVLSLAGGVDRWALTIDPKVPRY
jgi:rhodanese-related sulfurtransferase